MPAATLRAIALSPEDAVDEPALRTRRNLLAVRLALAARRRSLAEVDAVARDIEEMLERFRFHLVPWETTSLDLLLADAGALAARLSGDPMRFRRLANRLTALLPRRELPPPAAIACQTGLGHAFMRLGRIDDAIAVWQPAQEHLWERLLQIEGAGARSELIRLASPPLDIVALPGVGKDLPLGDELALAFIGRIHDGGLGPALAALERSRGIRRALAALPRSDTPAGESLAALRDKLRTARADCESADRAAAIEAGKDPRAATKAAERRQKVWNRAAEVEKAFRATLAEIGAPQVAVPGPGEIASALPRGGCLVAFAVGVEKGAAITSRSATQGPEPGDILPLPDLTRATVTRLLEGSTDSHGSHALLPAVAALRKDADFATRAAATGQLNLTLGFLATRLWEFVMGPLDCHLRDRGVEPGADIAIMAPGALAALPLHMASSASANGSTRMFLDDWIVRFVPDQRTFLAAARLRSRLADFPRRLLVIRDPGENLPGGSSPDPAEYIFPASSVTRLQGREATIANALAALPHQTTLSFSGHAVYEPLRPDRSGLVLAHPCGRDENDLPLPDILSVAALRALPTKCRALAALAACETAAAETADAADEFEGLAAELIDAGFASVIGATWPVDNRATDRFMTHFWEEYVETGYNAAAALRRAQLATRNNGQASHGDHDTLRAIGAPSVAERHTIEQEAASLPGPAAPFSWAGFRVIGA